jgi:riboflavin kinase/FMN adenylyltransferase
MPTRYSLVNLERDVILTIGTFDGVHLGHRHLVEQVMRRARERGCLSGAITFHPHPREVLTGQGPAYLSTLEERLALLQETGLDGAIALSFTPDLARLSALEFMEMLCQRVRLRELWVGWDFALGRGREGTAIRLTEIGQELGYRVHTVPPLHRNGQIVSSTLIRNLIHQGQVEKAAYLLGRCHRLHGVLLPGDPQRRLSGLLADKVAIAGNQALPAEGTYSVHVRSGMRAWSTKAYVGPMSPDSERQLELCLPHLDDGLYEQSIQVEFVRSLQARVPFLLPERFITQRQESPPQGQPALHPA